MLTSLLRGLRWCLGRDGVSRARRNSVATKSRPGRGRVGRGRPAGARPGVEALEARCVPSATLVRDINTAPVGSFPDALTAVGERLFFTANVPGIGVELWVSDGTEAGTRLVRDIIPGPNSSHPEAVTGGGARLSFRAVTRAAGRELWAGDGSGVA